MKTARVLALLILAFSSLDFGLTQFALSLGAQELNPLYHQFGAAAFWTAKVVTTLGFAGGTLLWWRMLPGAGQVGIRFAVFMGATPAIWNAISLFAWSWGPNG